MKTTNEMNEVAAKLIAQYDGIALFDLPDHLFAFGGDFDTLARAHGYAGGRSLANDWNVWSKTINEVVEMLATELA